MNLLDSSILEVAWPMLKRPVYRAGALVSPHASLVPQQRALHARSERQRVEHAVQVAQLLVGVARQVVQRLTLVK